MKIIKQGESGSKNTTANAENNTVDCLHTTVHPSLPKDARFELRWTLDFADMTKEQILEAAAEHFIIKIRRTFSRIEKPKNDDWNNVSFKVKDFITTRTSKIDKVAKTLADFSDEQLAALGLVRAKEDK